MEVQMSKEELNKSKQELKDYIYNKKWIEESRRYGSSGSGWQGR